jgi:hypothetical protein
MTSPGSISVSTLLDDYDLLEVEHLGDTPYVIAQRRSLTEVDYRELGTSSASPWTSFTRQEYNPQLRGLLGLQKYDQMRKSDGTVQGTLRLAKTPVMAARWYVEPGGKLKKDKTIADFVWKVLTDNMSISWPQFLMESLLMLDFGYYMFEKVWKEDTVDGKRRIVLKKLAPRHPMDVVQWHYDINGGPDYVEMLPPNSFANGNVELPIDKLLVFSYMREAGNIEGMSMLRTAFKHWYYKDNLYKIDAIQKERHGIGIPVITLPLGFDDNDRKLAGEIGRNLRTNERAHVVLPPNWEIIMLKLEGQRVDCLASADHHDMRIEKSILASFLSSTAADDSNVDLFLKATRFVADIVSDTINCYLIPQLVDYNFPKVRAYPKLRARRIGESADWRTQSFAIRNLVGAKIIRPDDELENTLRKEMDLPPVDEDTIRETETPQFPGADGGEDGDQPGAPRQKPSPPVGPPRGNAGTDRSGG